MSNHPATTGAWGNERDFEHTLDTLLRAHLLTTRKTFGYPASCVPGPSPRLRAYHCDYLWLPPSPLPPLNLSRVLKLPADARRAKVMAEEEAYRRQGPLGRMVRELRMLEAAGAERVWSGSYVPGKEMGFEREDWYGSGQREEWERRRKEEVG